MASGACRATTPAAPGLVLTKTSGTAPARRSGGPHKAAAVAAGMMTARRVEGRLLAPPVTPTNAQGGLSVEIVFCRRRAPLPRWAAARAPLGQTPAPCACFPA